MKSGPVAEKLQLKDVDFGVAFDKECHQYTFGKGKCPDSYSIRKIGKYMRLAESLLFSP
jgi:hypothetical protein